jgi:FkbM family methyltransferase
MLNIINNILKLIGAQLVGIGTLAKLRSENTDKDAFEKQKEIVQNARVIFDVGANYGQSIRRYSSMYGDAMIHSFEPQPVNFPELDKLKSERVVINKIALSSKEGEIKFYLKNDSGTASILKSVKIGASSDKAAKDKEEITVKTETLDGYCKANDIDYIDILKIDIQGGELEILKGSIKMLNEKKIKLIYTEIYFKQQYENQPLFSDIVSFLNSYGYFVQDIYNTYHSDKHLLWADIIVLT